MKEFRIFSMLIAMIMMVNSCTDNQSSDITLPLQSSDIFYWQKQNKIHVVPNHSAMILEFKSDKTANNTPNLWQLRDSTHILSYFRNPDSGRTLLYFRNSDTRSRERILADYDINSEYLEYVSFAYSRSGDTAAFFPTNSLVLKLKNNESLSSIQNLIQQYGLTLERNHYDSKIFRISNIDSVFMAARKIYESGFVEWCEPDLIYPITFP